MTDNDFARQVKLHLIRKQIKQKDQLCDVLVNQFSREKDKVIEFLDKICGFGLSNIRVIQWYWLWSKYSLIKKDIIGLERKKTYDFEETKKQLESNPYIYLGLSLQTCDKIVRDLDLTIEGARSRSVVARYLRDCVKNNGWVCIPEGLINHQFSIWREEKEKIIKEYDLIIFRNYIYFKKQYDHEQQVKLFFSKTRNILTPDDLSNLDTLTSESSIFGSSTKLTDEQLNAFKTACKSSCSLISGGAGTGKTTLIRCLIEFFKSRKINVIVLSFTGKAVSRIKEVTKEKNVFTIHKFLCSYSKILEQLSQPQVVIFDEASMIPLGLMAWFSRLCDPLQTILIGDPNQLPPIKPGQIFDDLIESMQYPHCCLTHTHRFCGSIYSNSLRILTGQSILAGPDVDIFPVDPTNYSLKIKEIFQQYDLYSRSQDITILCFYNQQLPEFNLLCQDLCNPLSPQKKIKVFGQQITWKIGDRVMMLENNYHWNVMNGEEGFISYLLPDRLQVQFSDNRLVDYLYSVPDQDHQDLSSDDRAQSSSLFLSDLRHSWAITVHKSQGSEWPFIVIPLPSWLRPDFVTRRLIYTAFTRAKSRCIILGNSTQLSQLLKRPLTKRHSNLSYLLSS